MGLKKMEIVSILSIIIGVGLIVVGLVMRTWPEWPTKEINITPKTQQK